MKKNNIIKIIIISILAITIFTNISYGFGLEDLKGDTSKLGDIKPIGGSILSVLSIIGSGLSIIFLIILGIKYMMGSIEQRAQYKKTLLPYVIGAIFVFAASSIAGLVYNMFN